MTIRTIIQPDNPVLRKKASKVAVFDKKFQTLVDDMIETMTHAAGVGLAAPQVAVSQRLIVICLGTDEKARETYGDDAGKLFVVANPKIIKASKEIVEGVEACLSIPGYYGTVDRHEAVTVAGQDRHGKAFRHKAKGWLARVFQHEIDHLDGRLYIDIAKDVWEARPEDEQDEDEAQPERESSPGN